MGSMRGTGVLVAVVNRSFSTLTPLFTLTIAALTIAACGGPGTALRVDGDLPALEAEYRARARANPGDATALASLGAVLHASGRHDEAVRHLSRAAGLAPTDPEIARWQGEALLGAKRPIEAHRAFARALEHDQDWRPRYHREVEPRVLEGLAAKAATNKNVSRVVALVRKLDADLLKRHPKPAARIWEAEGDTLFGAGSNHQAIAAYDRALGTGQARPEVRFKLGRCHAVLRQLDKAKARFEEYVSGATEDVQTKRMIEIAEFLDERFLFEQSRRWYRRASDARPDDQKLRRAHAIVLLKARQWSDATKVFDRLLNGSRDAKAYIDVARLYLKYRRVDEAISTWRKAIELSPDDVGQWKVLAHLLVDKGRKREIEAIIGHTEQHERWGDVYTDLRDPKQAAARYRKALDAGAGPEVLIKLALAYHRARDTARRDKTLEAYEKATGGASKGLAAVAAAYEKMGEKAMAMTAWKRLASSDPAHRDAAFALARLHTVGRDAKAAAAALERWAAATSRGADRAAAWLEVATWYQRGGHGGGADKAVAKVLAQGETPSRRPALLIGASVHRRLLQSYARSEELYQAWIDAAPEAERHEARQRVSRQVRGVAAMRRFRSRLLEDMVRDSPKDARTWYTLGESYLTGRPPLYAEAGRAFDRFIELSPDRREAIIDVGARLSRANAWSAAARVYSKLAVEEIGQLRLHLTLAQLYLRGQVNDQKRARAHLQRFLDSMGDPDRTVSDQLSRLAAKLSSVGLHDMAVTVYERLRPHRRKDTRLLQALGSALLGLGRDAEADEVFQSYLEATGRKHDAVRRVAEAFFRKKFYRRARTYYESLFNARMRSRLPQHFQRLFDIYLKLGDRSGLLGLARRFVKLRSGSRAYSEAARRLEQAGLLREALEFWGHAADKSPGAHTFREQQASLALRLGDVEAAERYLGQMVTARRGQADAWVRAGKLLSEAGHDERALELYENAMAQGTDTGPVHLARAAVYLRQGKFDAAHADFTRALTLAQNLDQVLAELRPAYLKAGRLSKYVDLLRRATALFPNRADTWYELGDVALRQGRHSEARGAFDKYVKGNEKGLMQVGARLWQAGDIRGAKRFFEKAMESPLFDGRHRALAETMAALSALGRPERVPDAVTRFLTASANPTQDLAMLARLLEETGYVAEAIAYYERMAKGRAVQDLQLRLGRLWLAAGDVEAARAAFERHIGVVSVDGPMVFRGQRSNAAQDRVKRLGDVIGVYERAGRLDDALELVELAAGRHPEFAALHVERARLLLGRGRVLAGLGALEGLVRNRTVGAPRDEGLESLDKLIRFYGRDAEALDLLRRTLPSSRSVPLSLQIVRLSLRLGEHASATEEIERLLAQSPHGALRLGAGRALFDAGRYTDAADVLLDALEPGRGAGSIEAAVRLLLVVARMSAQPALVADVSARVGRFYEDRRHYHRLMTTALLDTGYFDEAVDHATEWVAAVGDRPKGTEPLRAARGTAPSPWAALLTATLVGGDDAAAVAVAERYVTAARDSAAARDAVAELFRHHLAWGPALTMYEQAIAANAADGPSRLSAGRMALQRGDVERAKTHFEAYVSRGDDQVHSHGVVARIWAAYGYEGEAERHYALVTRQGPGTLANDELRPMMWLRAGDESKAREALRTAVASSPDPLVAELRFAAHYLTGTEMTATLALELAQSALERRAEAPHPVAQLVRAAALAELGRADEAKAALMQVVARGGADDVALGSRRGVFLGPKSAVKRSYQLFALKALAGRQLALARYAIDELVAKDTAEARLAAVAVLQQAFQDRRDWTEADARHTARLALDLLEPLQARTDLMVGLVDQMAALHEQAGDLERAIHTYRAAMKRFPEQAHLKNNLAYMLARRDQHLEEALTLVRKAEALNPAGNLAYLDTEGWTLFKLGRHEEALQKIEAAIRQMTARDARALSESLYHLGRTLAAMGRHEAAKRAYERAWQAGPSSEYGRKAKTALDTVE